MLEGGAEAGQGAREVQREGAVAACEKSLVAKYERIRKQRGGVAVMPVVGGTCKGCQMNIPPHMANLLRTGREIQTCPSCYRFIYAADPGRAAAFGRSLEISLRRESVSGGPGPLVITPPQLLLAIAEHEELAATCAALPGMTRERARQLLRGSRALALQRGPGAGTKAAPTHRFSDPCESSGS